MAISRTTKPARDQPAAGRLSNLLNQRAEELQRRQPGNAAARRSLVAAMFGFFFRLAILLVIMEAAIVWWTADRQDLQGQPLGYILHYAIWSAIGQASFYPALDEFLQSSQSALPFLLPAALSAALTFYFLPSINAARRKTGPRFAVYIINTLTGWSGIGWIIALIASFAGGRGQPQMAPASGNRPGRPRRSILPSTGPASFKPTRSAVVRTMARSEPAIMRRGSSQSWVRPR
jgi:Superinfection immunity protein